MTGEYNGKVTDGLLPPETTTPMPPQLHAIYEKALGWPGRPDQLPPAAMPPKWPAPPPHDWLTSIAKMSPPTDSVQP